MKLQTTILIENIALIILAAYGIYFTNTCWPLFALIFMSYTQGGRKE
jgi:hypothetical protein